MLRFRLLAVIAVLLLVVAACGEEDAALDDEPDEGVADEEEEPDDDDAEVEDDAAADDDAGTDDDATDDTATDDTADDAGVEVAVADSDLGEILVDGEGLTLYLFDADEDGESTCYDDCATNWPPLVTDGEPAAAEGVDEGMLGTTERDDGSMQVTYDGHPLYYWVGDDEPGDVEGQAVQDVWWVLDADGNAIHDEAGEADASGGY